MRESRSCGLSRGASPRVQLDRSASREAVTGLEFGPLIVGCHSGETASLVVTSSGPQNRPMPEGPEIRRAADRIEAAVGGQEVRDVFFAFARLKGHADELRGRTVTRVETRGKAMLTWFDDELAVYSHNQLYGRWFTRKSPGLPNTRRQLRFAIHTDRASALLYSASEIAVLDAAGLREHPFLAKLGLDPLHPDAAPRRIAAHLRASRYRRRQLTGLFLEQSCLAGLGNYLRSEILFIAGVHPRARPTDLDDARLHELARAVRATVRRAYQTGGITTDAATVAEAKRAGQRKRQYRHWVFGRAGRACRRCGDLVVREESAGRRLYWCPGCQVR